MCMVIDVAAIPHWTTMQAMDKAKTSMFLIDGFPRNFENVSGQCLLTCTQFNPSQRSCRPCVSSIRFAVCRVPCAVCWVDATNTHISCSTNCATNPCHSKAWEEVIGDSVATKFMLFLDAPDDVRTVRLRLPYAVCRMQGLWPFGVHL